MGKSGHIHARSRETFPPLFSPLFLCLLTAGDRLVATLQLRRDFRAVLISVSNKLSLFSLPASPWGRDDIKMAMHRWAKQLDGPPPLLLRVRPRWRSALLERKGL